MPSLDAPEERLRKFKYRGKDASLRQRQRMAVSLKLRKAKKDEQTLKRRNITSFCPDTPSEKTAKEVAVSLTLGEIIQGVNSSDPALCFQATQTARKMLSQEKNPGLKLVVEGGLIPRMVEFLKPSLYPCLQCEAAWALTDIAAGTSEHSPAVVERGAIQPLMALLSSPNLAVCEQAVWALGNIASDCPEFRDKIISSSAIPHLLALISHTLPITFLRNIMWTLSNLCRHKNPYPCDTAVKQILPALLHLLQHHDSEVLSDARWALSYLTDSCSNRISQVVDTGVLPRLVVLLNSSELNTQRAIDTGTLNMVPQLLQHSKPSIQKEAAWALSNLAAGPCQHIQQLLAYDSLPPLVAVLKHGEFKVQKEAIWTVANFVTGATMDQLIQLVHSGILEPLVNLLTAPDVKIVLIILDVISFILEVAEKLSEKEHVCLLIEELGGIDRIEALQLHEKRQISLLALNIIEKHFSEEEDESLMLPSQVVDQDCEFINCDCLAKKK
uniref:Importin subunit alpha n=1 Tax=Saimiri boliviensis boliviensis TaxID=39432 RepID=A0A2K6UG20_SAIBB